METQTRDDLQEQKEELQFAIHSDEYSMEQAEKRIKLNKNRIRKIELLIDSPEI